MTGPRPGTIPGPSPSGASSVEKSFTSRHGLTTTLSAPRAALTPGQSESEMGEKKQTPFGGPLVLRAQEMPQEQGRLFGRSESPELVTKANGALLQWMTDEARLGSVDDLLAWEHHNQGRGACIRRCGYTAPVGLMKGCRVYCPRCGTHTVSSARDISTGHTPGPVAEEFERDYQRPGCMGGGEQ